MAWVLGLGGLRHEGWLAAHAAPSRSSSCAGTGRAALAGHLWRQLDGPAKVLDRQLRPPLLLVHIALPDVGSPQGMSQRRLGRASQPMCSIALAPRRLPSPTSNSCPPLGQAPHQVGVGGGGLGVLALQVDLRSREGGAGRGVACTNSRASPVAARRAAREGLGHHCHHRQLQCPEHALKKRSASSRRPCVAARSPACMAADSTSSSRTFSASACVVRERCKAARWMQVASNAVVGCCSLQLPDMLVANKQHARGKEEERTCGGVSSRAAAASGATVPASRRCARRGRVGCSCI